MGRSLAGLIKMIRFMFDKEVDFGKKLLFFLPFIYLILPFDLIGDFFPLAGQLDDVAVFIIMWPILKKLLAGYQPGAGTEKKHEDAVDMNPDDYEIK